MLRASCVPFFISVSFRVPHTKGIFLLISTSSRPFFQSTIMPASTGEPHCAHDTLFTTPVRVGTKKLNRPLYFYVILNTADGISATKRIIHRHGGRVAESPGGLNSGVICLVEPNANASPRGRKAYSALFVHDCIEKGKLLDLGKYQLVPSGGRENQLGRTPTAIASTPSASLANVTHSNRKSAKSNMSDDDFALTNMFGDRVYPWRTKSPLVMKGKQHQVALNESSGDQTQPPPDIEMRSEDMKNVQTSSKGSEEREQQVRSPSNLQANGNHGKELTSKKSFESITERMPWSAEEDEKIMDICRLALESPMMRKQTKTFFLNITKFRKLKERGESFLPPNRSAEQCLERAWLFWDDIEIAVEGAAGSQRNSRPKRKRRAVAESLNALEDEEKSVSTESVHHNIGLSQNVLQGEHSHKKIMKMATPSSTRSKKKTPANNQTDIRVSPEDTRTGHSERVGVLADKKKQVIALVKRIARKGMVSEREAFRTFRDSGANWKKALQVIRKQRKSGRS